MKRKLVYLFALLLIFTKPYAQVNLQTGGATFSLPMFNWQDDKSRLTSIVALSYNSGNGLKVNDVASNVGQGWNLVAGGVITRMQVGEPDDQQPYNGDGTDLDIRRYPGGYFCSDIPAYNGCPNTLTKYPIYGSRNQVYSQRNTTNADRQLDYFSFQFNGKAGMFILDTIGGDHGVPIGDTKMKIRFDRDISMANGTSTGIRTMITSFTIQDVDGLTYTFSYHGLTQVLEQTYCDAKLIQAQTQPKFADGQVYHQKGFVNSSYVNPWIIGSWYLSQIYDSLTSRKILFNYNTTTLNNAAGEDFSYNQWHNYTIISHKVSSIKTLDLTSIVYPDGHTVTFNYASSSRVDLTGEKALASVDVAYQGRYLSEYQLNTTYFILNRYGTPTTPYQKSVARLCLKSVKKLGVDLKEDTPPYIFDYYLGSNADDDYVPPPFFWAKDVWGYYNGNNSTNFQGTVIGVNKSLSQLLNSDLQGLCFSKTGVSSPDVYLNAKSGYAQNGLLRQIIYPTGGTLTYQYAQNTGVFDGTSNTVTVGGVHVSQTSSTDGGYSNGCANPITTQYNFAINGAGSASSLWGLETPVNYIISGSHYAPEQKHYSFSFKCLLGCCQYGFMYPGILSKSESINLSDFQKFMEAITPVLSILSVVTDIMDVVTLACGPSGFLTWAAVIVDIIGSLVQIGVTCAADYTKDGSSLIYYNSDLNSASPLPTQFKRVEVVENPGTIGKTVYEFTSSDDYPVWIPAGGNSYFPAGSNKPNFTAQQRFAPWAYGLPKTTTVYDASGNMIKQTTNVYDMTWVKSLIEFQPKHLPYVNNLQTPLVSCKCGVLYPSSQNDIDWKNSIETYTTTPIPDIMTVDFYGMYTGRSELHSTSEKVFKVDDQQQYVETTTTYTYNFNNYEPSQIATTQSNGDDNYKTINYSCDYTGGVMNTLARYNIVSLPVATNTTVNKASTWGTQYLNEKVTEFAQLANGDIKPSRVLEQRFAQPTSTISLYGGPGSSTSNYKVSQTFTYDDYGNLIGLQDEGYRLITNIYDYNDKYIAASVINADPLVDHAAYASFETNDLARSGWTLSGAAAYVNSAITGTRSFALTSSKNFSASLNTSKPYILSFWASSSLTVTGGATQVKSGPAYNGFSYYEYSITQGTTSVSVSGNANIDELRLYPTTARMRTTTYDPLIGKTSECDENNRITYYEYDNLGRLLFVKDENKNIVKMYEYNNVSAAKQNGCPGTYSSHLVSELFTRSCTSGYQGSDVTFTIPAGRYTSTISQADADAQAELDLLTNGQVYADNPANGGTCSLIYYNVQQTESDSSESCGPGKKGGWVTYTVPAGRYSSIISQADADQQALDEIAANAIAYANSPAHRICMVDNDPVWQASTTPSVRCQTYNGSNTGNQEALATDVNPNSPTYNQQQWKYFGVNTSACPYTPVSPPSLPNGQSSISATGIINGVPGTVVTITVTFNSSEPSAYLSGTVGFPVSMTGSGTQYANGTATIPGSGYIVWSLTLSGPSTHAYISSNITVQ